jgi:hypothetical protein
MLVFIMVCVAFFDREFFNDTPSHYFDANPSNLECK